MVGSWLYRANKNEVLICRGCREHRFANRFSDGLGSCLECRLPAKQPPFSFPPKINLRFLPMVVSSRLKMTRIGRRNTFFLVLVLFLLDMLIVDIAVIVVTVVLHQSLWASAVPQSMNGSVLFGFPVRLHHTQKSLVTLQTLDCCFQPTVTPLRLLLP